MNQLGTKVTHAELIQRFGEGHPLNGFIRTLIKYHMYHEKIDDYDKRFGIPDNRVTAYVNEYFGGDWTDEKVCRIVDACRNAFSEIKLKHELMDVGINLIDHGTVLVTPEYFFHLAPNDAVPDSKETTQKADPAPEVDAQNVSETVDRDVKKPGKRVTYAELNRRFGKTEDAREVVGMLTRNKLYRNELTPAHVTGKRLFVDLNEYLDGLGAQYLINEFKNKCLDAFAVPSRKTRLNAVGIYLVEDNKVLLTPDFCIYIKFRVKSNDPIDAEPENETVVFNKTSIKEPTTELDESMKADNKTLSEKAKFIRELMVRKTYVHRTMCGTHESYNPRPTHSPYEQTVAPNVLVRLDDTVLSRVLTEFSKQSNFEHALFEENIVLKEESYTQVDEDDNDVVVVRMAACLIADNGVVHCTFTPHTTDLYNLDNLN